MVGQFSSKASTTASSMVCFGPVSLKGLFSLAFRAPGVENLSLGPWPEVLRPERTLVFELEGSWEIIKGMHLSANVFDVGITDPIAYSVAASGDESYRNWGRQGYELPSMPSASQPWPDALVYS